MNSMVPVTGVELSVTERGEGQPTLVFLHYWGGSAQTWSETIDSLAGTHRCIAFAFRGWGESSKGALDYGLDALASDTLALIAQLGLTNYMLVGHSMGGKVAQMVAATQPIGLKGLVLVAPAPPTPWARRPKPGPKSEPASTLARASRTCFRFWLTGSSQAFTKRG